MINKEKFSFFIPLSCHLQAKLKKKFSKLQQLRTQCFPWGFSTYQDKQRDQLGCPTSAQSEKLWVVGVEKRPRSQRCRLGITMGFSFIGLFTSCLLRSLSVSIHSPHFTSYPLPCSQGHLMSSAKYSNLSFKHLVFRQSHGCLHSVAWHSFHAAISIFEQSMHTCMCEWPLTSHKELTDVQTINLVHFY